MAAHSKAQPHVSAGRSQVLSPADAGRARWQRAGAVSLAAASLCLVAVIVWAHPRPVADMYVGLAGGRDIAEGRLGQPDDWSFLTTGRVWIDQNWGTHLIYYHAYTALGEAGLLATKAAMIGLMVMGVVLICRARGAGTGVSLLAAAGVVLAAKSFIDLRPNLVTLMFSPWMLLLLWLSRRQVHWIWLALPLMLLWANMHGGFTFGIGMLGLWALCHIACTWVSSGPAAAIRKYWPLAGVTAAAIAVAGLANPFGLENLKQALIVGKSSAWREVLEWRSMFDPQSQGLKFHWPFLTVIGLTVLLSLTHLLDWLHRRQSGLAPALRLTAPAVAWAIFDIILLSLVVYMAVAAQRFSPLAMLVAAPLLAQQLEWLLGRDRRPWALAAACLLVLAPAALLGARVVRHYSPASPVAGPESFLSRMANDSAVNPGNLAQFINDNEITGRIFQDWAWEGYLRWKCSSRLQLWIGARAQQVYTEDEYKERLSLMSDANGVGPMLSRLDIHLVAVPTTLAKALWPVLARRPQATWAVIYFDGINILLADCEHPGTRALVDAALENRLKWPSENIALLSRAICMSSTPVLRGGDTAPARHLLRQSIARQANPLQTLTLVALSTRSNGAMEESDAQFLADQYNRYAAAPQPQARGSMIVAMCSDIAKSLMKHYRLTDRLVETQYWEKQAAGQKRELDEIEKRWTMR